MHENSLVSVIIPVFNASHYLTRSVSSILQQTYGPIELLICDDCSTDGSWEILQTFSDPRIRLFKNQANRGYLRVVNDLVSKAGGRYLCFQDADDYSHPERISMQVKRLRCESDLGLVGTNYALINRKDTVRCRSNVDTNPQTLRKALEVGNPFQKPSIMFKREVYEKVGMYREHFLTLGNISEDFDWILRVSERFDVGNINHIEPLYFYRCLSTSMSRKISSIYQLFGHDIALHLSRQRKTGQKDSIEQGELEALEQLILKLREPFDRDTSLFHHKLAESYMYCGLNIAAIWQALLAVSKKPLSWNNYRLLQYCVRKTFLRL